MKKILLSILAAAALGWVACAEIPTETTVHIDGCMREDSLIVNYDSLYNFIDIDTIYMARCVNIEPELP